MTKLLPLTAVIGALSASLASAATVSINTSSSAPDPTNVIRSNVAGATPANLTAYSRPPGGSDIFKNVGQGFSLEAGSPDYMLQSVTFALQGYGTGILEKNYKIEIYRTNASSTIPSAGNLFQTFEGTMLDSLTANDYLTFQFSEEVSLSAGYFYNVVFSFTELTSETSTVQSLSLKTVGSGVSITSGGSRWIGIDKGDGNGLSYDRSVSNGLVFYAQGYAIPEPSTTALIVAAGIGLAALRQRHQSAR